MLSSWSPEPEDNDRCYVSLRVDFFASQVTANPCRKLTVSLKDLPDETISDTQLRTLGSQCDCACE